MSENLLSLFLTLKKNYKPASSYDLEVIFYPYKNVSHTIRLRKGIIHVRLSDKIKDAPDDLIKAIGTILFDKLFRYKTHASVRKYYARYVNSLVLPAIEPSVRKVSPRYKAKGAYYDLDEIFEISDVISVMSDGRLSEPVEASKVTREEIEIGRASCRERV